MFKKSLRGTGSERGFHKSSIYNCIIRFFQIVLALTVVGLYGSDLNAAHKRHKYSDSKWVYAVAVGSIAAISALLIMVGSLLLKTRTLAMVFPFEWFVVILWAVLTGIFASMYFPENPEMDGGIQTMKSAAGCDLANLLLWIISAIVSTVLFFFGPKRSLHTGRATL